MKLLHEKYLKVSTIMLPKEKKPPLDVDLVRKLNFKPRRNIFSKIIKKYSRTVKRVDIVDLKEMEIVVDGGYLRHKKPRPFAFPKYLPRARFDLSIQDENNVETQTASPQKINNESSETLSASRNLDSSYSKKVNRRVPVDSICIFIEKSLDYSEPGNNFSFSQDDKCNTPKRNKTKGSNSSHLAIDSSTASNEICSPISLNKTKNAVWRSSSESLLLPHQKNNQKAVVASPRSPCLNNSDKFSKVDYILPKQSSTPERILKNNYNASKLTVQNSLECGENVFTNTPSNYCITVVMDNWSPKIKKQLAKVKIDDLNF